MKKSILLLFIATLLLSGPIESKYNQINQIEHPMIRVEKKLDLLLEQLIIEERIEENREQAIDDAIDTTKDKFKQGANWLNKQIQK